MPGLLVVLLIAVGSTLALGVVLSRVTHARILRSLASEPLGPATAADPLAPDAFDAPSRIVTLEELEEFDEPIDRAS